MNRPYLHTWTAQDDAIDIEIDGVEDYHHLSKDKKYLDFSSVSFQASFGLKNTKITEAIKKQLEDFSVTSPKHNFTLKEKVSYKLLEDLELVGKIFYTVSGAESIENALKMARQFTGKQKVLARKDCYHGATLGALSITGDWRNNAHKTINDWTVRIPDHFEDPSGNSIEEVIKEVGAADIAAICLETMTGANGVHQAPELWYKKIQELCDKYNILLILDEVICGFGRTGKKFGFHHYPFLEPDFVCLSKAMTGGYIPFGAVFVGEKVSTYYNKNILSCGLTNYAHALGLAALGAVQEINDNPMFWQHLKSLEKELDTFKTANSSESIKMRRFGLMMAIEHNKDLQLNDFLKEGIYLVVKKDLIIIAPALTMPMQTLKDGLEKVIRIIHGK